MTIHPTPTNIFRRPHQEIIIKWSAGVQVLSAFCLRRTNNTDPASTIELSESIRCDWSPGVYWEMPHIPSRKDVLELQWGKAEQIAVAAIRRNSTTGHGS